MPKAAEPVLMEKWKIQDSVETYGVRTWGKGYFSINKAGHLQVHPTKRGERHVDLKELIDQLIARGIQLPILLRFTDILRHRVGELHEAFQNAIKEAEYKNRYCCVYPIKVNQQRQVVEEILDFGKPFHFGLEAGSKPELLAVVALTQGNTKTEVETTPIICNGFKDDEFIKMVDAGAEGSARTSSPSSRSSPSWNRIVRHAEELDVRPGDRRARQARQPGERAGGSQLGRLPQQVRPDASPKCWRRIELPQGARHGRLPATRRTSTSAARSPTSASMKDALNEAARVYIELLPLSAPAAEVPRRRRRPRRRLRRLPDRLRIERELHAAGVRQRRRLPHQERLRREPAFPHPIDHQRIGPGRWSPTTACWSSTCWGPQPLRQQHQMPGRTARGRAAADQGPLRHPPRA